MSRFLPFGQWLIVTVLCTAILLGSSGRLDLPMVWACVCVYSSFHLAIAFTVYKKDPDLFKERARSGPGAKRWDRVWLVFYQLLSFATWIVAGLDIGRFHWSDTVPLWLQIVGLAGLAASFGFAVWAMATNTFFSQVVRIQDDRGHHVVTGGPYRYVRHPGYAGGMLAWLCTALALGSWWALFLAGVIVLVYVIRTALEDRTLHEELEGYAEYAKRVRYRLLPGVW